MNNNTEMINGANPSMIWSQYMDFLTTFGRNMKATYVKRLRENNPFTWEDLDKVNDNIHNKLDYLMTWSEKFKSNSDNSVNTLTESKLRQLIAEKIRRILNEGPGAGYTVSLSGLSLTNTRITNIEGEGYDAVVYFTAQIAPSNDIEWSAEGAYDYVSSNGIEYDGTIMEETPTNIKGGTIEGYCDLWVLCGDVKIEDIDDKNELVDALNKLKISVSQMIGGGYVHQNLTSTIAFEGTYADVDNYWNDEQIFVERILVDAPEITKCINWFFANNHKFDEIYGEETEEQVNEHRRLNRNILTESKLRKIIRDVINESL